MLRTPERTGEVQLTDDWTQTLAMSVEVPPVIGCNRIGLVGHKRALCGPDFPDEVEEIRERVALHVELRSGLS